MSDGRPSNEGASRQSRLTIAGLGPGNRALRTLAVQSALDAAPQILLRTGRHPGIQDLLADPRVSTCDDLSEQGLLFDEVSQAIVERVIERAQEMPLVYAVPGHPQDGERTVAGVLASAHEHGLPVTVLPGISVLDAVATALSLDLVSEQAQIVDAAEVMLTQGREPFGRGMLAIDPARPVLVTHVFSAAVAAAVKLFLAEQFGDEHEVVLVTAALVPGEQQIQRRPVHQLDRVPVHQLTNFWVPALDPIMASRSGATLTRIVARLRAPAGCPWDRKQTYQTLRDDLLNETYEVLDAIDKGDAENLTEELGDVLLVVSMLAQIAEEAGDFALFDVFQHVNEKLVRRHPHVFGSVQADNAERVVENWNAIKAAERAERLGGAPSKEPAPFDRWPASMPALLKAQRILSRELRQKDAPPAGALAQGEAERELLAVVERLVAAGVDLEAALEGALRERYGEAGRRDPAEE